MTAPTLKPSVRVVAAVIYDVSGHVLVDQRPSGTKSAGQWEFPGGKVEAGESDFEALKRELHEELGIELIRAHALMELSHEYTERRVQLSVWIVDEIRGVPVGVEGQVLQWLMPAALRMIPLLAADLPVLEWLEKNERKR